MAEQARDKAPRGMDEFVALIPRMARFVSHLARDPRVPWTAKAAVLLLGAYIVWPNDLLPDTIPWVGMIDDLLVLAIIMNYVFGAIPEEILLEHWGEDIEPRRAGAV